MNLLKLPVSSRFTSVVWGVNAPQAIFRNFMLEAKTKVNDVLLELVKNVSHMQAKVDAIETSMLTMQTQVGTLNDLASQAQGFSNAAKALWTLIGLLIGAGGSEAVQTLLGM